jgi:hypothetical protein
VALAAAEKPVRAVEGSNDSAHISARAYVGREKVKEILGADPGVDMILVEVKVRPAPEKTLRIWHDDFILLSNKDGQRSQPLAPSQIAGQGALVVHQTGGSGRSSGIGMGPMGPVWGGPMGRPRRLGVDDVMITDGTQGEVKARVDAEAKVKDNEALAVLKRKQLPESEVSEEVSGYLYFLLEGKHKLKDLDLLYKTPTGRIVLDFEK